MPEVASGLLEFKSNLPFAIVGPANAGNGAFNAFTCSAIRENDFLASLNCGGQTGHATVGVDRFCGRFLLERIFSAIGGDSNRHGDVNALAPSQVPANFCRIGIGNG